MKDEMRQRHRISDSDSQATTCSLDLNWKEKSISLATVNYISHMEIGKYVNCAKSEMRVANCPWRDSKYNFASLCCVAQLSSAARIRAENIADYVI